MMVKITRTCMFCRQPKTVEVPQSGLDMLKAGAHIQDAMPDVSPGDRELLISGVCNECFDATFKEE